MTEILQMEMAAKDDTAIVKNFKDQDSSKFTGRLISVEYGIYFYLAASQIFLIAIFSFLVFKILIILSRKVLIKISID